MKSSVDEYPPGLAVAREFATKPRDGVRALTLAIFLEFSSLTSLATGDVASHERDIAELASRLDQLADGRQAASVCIVVQRAA